MAKYVEMSANVELDMTAILGKQLKKTLDLRAITAEEAKKMRETKEAEKPEE